MTNKNVDYIGDGATYVRTTSNQRDGGGRAYNAIDSGNVAVASAVDFSRPYTGKHLDNIPDGASRFSVVNGAGMKGVASVDGSNLALVNFASPHTNKNLDNISDGTRSAWDSGTQKTAAVDSSGNLKLKNLANPSMVTVNPQTSSTSYVVISEMTQTITTKGNKVLVIFTISMVDTSGAPLTSLAIFRDGVQITQDYNIVVGTNGAFMSIAYIDTPSAGSHTYDVRWHVTVGTTAVSCYGLGRNLQIVELG